MLSRFKNFIPNNCLETTVYSKPTESHVYLEALSFYNKSSKNGIIKGLGSTISRKPRLRNSKDHIKKNVRFCQIAMYFVDEC